MTCCVLHNICIDNGESMEMDLQLDEMLSNFQESDNDDGVEFDLSGDVEIDVSIPTDNHNLTERELAALMRNLKLRGQLKRISVQNSL